MREFHAGATALLAYFHYCNRGNRPFELDWNSASLVASAGLCEEQVNFVKDTAIYVQQNRKFEFRFISDFPGAKMDMVRKEKLFGDDLFFVSQLYDKEWEAVPTL
jgi:hypothetical protein